MSMKAISKIIAVAALMAVAAVSAPKASAQEIEFGTVKIGSDIEFNMGLGFGINFFSGIDDHSIYEPMQKAWGLDFTFNFAEFYWGLNPNNQLFLTLGLENKSFRMRDKFGYGKEEFTETLLMVPYNDMKMSALRVFSWNVGMGYRYEVDKDLAFKIGPIVNFNTGSRFKTKYYDLEGKKHKEKTKWGHQELVTIEAMGMIEFHGIGLYVKYNPFPLLEKDYGPEVTTWSIGIML